MCARCLCRSPWKPSSKRYPRWRQTKCCTYSISGCPCTCWKNWPTKRIPSISMRCPGGTCRCWLLVVSRKLLVVSRKLLVVSCKSLVRQQTANSKAQKAKQQPAMADISIGKAPHPIAVLPFYGTGAVCFAALALLLFLASGELMGHHFSPHLLAIVHTAALGWGTMVIFGAAYQLLPVVCERSEER